MGCSRIPPVPAVVEVVRGHYGDAVSTGQREARRATGAAGVVVVLIFVCLVLPVFVPGAPWTAGPPATCLASGCFCEAVGWGSPVRQPIAAISSLAFSVTSVAVLLSWARAARLGRPRMPGSWLAVYAAGCALVGLGSAYLHGSLTFLGQFADVAPMQATALVLLGYALRTHSRWQRQGLPAYLAMAVAASAAAWWLPGTRRYLFVAFVSLGIVAEFAGYRFAPPRRLVLAVGVFAVAGVVWVLDGTGLCRPASWVQGHALWHILSAVAAYLLFGHYQRDALRRSRAHETVGSSVYRG